MPVTANVTSNVTNATVLDGIITDTIESRNQGLVTTIAASLSLIASPGIPMQTARALSVISISRCTFDYDGEVDFPITTWPGFSIDKGLKGAFLRGAVIADAGTFFGFLVVMLAIAMAYRGLLKTTFVTAASALRYPAFLLIPFGFTVNGLITCMVAAATNGGSEVYDRAVALIAVVTVLLVTAVAAYIAFRVAGVTCDVVEVAPPPSSALYGRFLWTPRKDFDTQTASPTAAATVSGAPEFEEASPLTRGSQAVPTGGATIPPPTTPPPQPPVASVPLPPPRPAATNKPWWAESGTPAEVHQAAGAVYNTYISARRGFYLAELWTTVFVLGANGAMPTSRNGCTAAAAVVACLTGLFAAVAVVGRPHTCPAFNYILSVNTAMTFLGAVFVAAGLAAESKALLSLGQGLALISGYVAVLGPVAIRAYVRFVAKPPPPSAASTDAKNGNSSGGTAVAVAAAPRGSAPRSLTAAPSVAQRDEPPRQQQQQRFDRAADIDACLLELLPETHREFLDRNGSDLAQLLGPSAPSPPSPAVAAAPVHDDYSRTRIKASPSSRRFATAAPFAAPPPVSRTALAPDVSAMLDAL